MDNDSILSGLLTPTKYATIEQRRRAQQHAYALMQQPDEKYTSWTQGARDVVNALVGRHIINQTTQQESEAMRGDAASQASLLDEIQRKARSQSAPPPQATAPTPAPVTTGSLSPEAAGGIAGSAQPNPNSDVLPNQIEAPKTGFKMDEYLKQLTGPESSGGTNTKINQYGYGGPFGLRKGEYGLNDGNWKEASAHVGAAALKTVDNMKAYRAVYDRNPTNEELHLMHNQGATGGLAHMASEPDKPAFKVLMDSNPGLKEDLAKTRIKAQIGSGNPLSKVPVEKITTGEFQTYMADKFNGGWKGNTSVNRGRLPGQIGGGAVGEDTPAVAAAQAGPQGQQIAQANGIPPAVAAPSASVDKDNLARFLSSSTIPQATKDKIQEMMIQGATPVNRETAQGVQQYRPSNPSETSTPGSGGFSPFSIGEIHTVQRTVVGPDGKPETMVMIPNGKGQWTSMEGMKEWLRDQKSQDEFRGENTKRLGEDYSKYQQLGNSASEQVQNLDLMKQTLNDPNMYTGTGDQKVLDWKKFLVTMGKDPNDRAAPAEVFKKLMAGGVLEGLGQFKGLGQIRVAEIEQLQKSLADTNMTKPAIMAVLNLNQKAHERHIEISNEASRYAATHNDRLDTGWDAHLREWKKEHPFMTKDDIKNWKEEFAGKAPTAAAPIESKPEPGKRVYNPITRKWE